MDVDGKPLFSGDFGEQSFPSFVLEPGIQMPNDGELLIWSAATAGSPREHLAWGAVVAAFPKALTSQRTP